MIKCHASVIYISIIDDSGHEMTPHAFVLWKSINGVGDSGYEIFRT